MESPIKTVHRTVTDTTPRSMASRF
jgi:hypothetical protein